jgi:hypothetical protein
MNNATRANAGFINTLQIRASGDEQLCLVSRGMRHFSALARAAGK